MSDTINKGNFITIDGEYIETKAEFYSSLRQQFEPDFTMGFNLDAFHDVLTSIGTPTLIVLKNKPQLEDHLGNYWTAAYQVIIDSMEENSCLGICLGE